MSSVDATQASPQEIERILDSFQDIPTIPDVLIRIWKIVDDPDSSASDLEEAVAMEASLAAKVLRLANSPYFGGRGRIADLVCGSLAPHRASSPRQERLGILEIPEGSIHQ